jgi:hypothetical protein
LTLDFLIFCSCSFSRLRYGEVYSPGYLHLYKDKKTADQFRFQIVDPSQSPDSNATVIDLRTILDFKEHSSEKKNTFELEIELPVDSLRIRFKTATELQRWRNGIQEWKDFLLDYGK